ncbi:hypothetical protein FIV50_04680 [Microbacterium foliorum]|uniref:Uncharacterized protein n=1 Tax=Microbacterium foliorum TaxID=104336 RepID=A0A4Y5YNZ7_9MICO|nr:hypothetical protein [Microbacterium foliorum]QDE34149.1 hypothetical protein FIV50_04680 [Microbacterium foliorum]
MCTPTMFEDELRALTSMPSFSDPRLSDRVSAVIELRKAIKAVREIPGWSGDSEGDAQNLLDRMEGNANRIQAELAAMQIKLGGASSLTRNAASDALSALPSASAEGILADAGRSLSGITDGWGGLDTGELVAQEEAKLAAERENAAMKELTRIRSTLSGHAATQFRDEPARDNADTTSVPLPVIDVDGIDSRVPPVGSNGPSAGGSAPQGGTGVGTWTPQPGGGWVPGGDGGSGGGNGGSGGGNDGSVGDNDFGNGGNGGSVGDNEWGNGGNGGDTGWGNGGTGGSGSGGAGDPSVDSPIGGTLPGYPGGGSGGGGGLLSGGSGGSGTLGAAVVGGAGAAALMGARSASLSGTSGASLFGGGGSGAGAGAATAGRGLLGMNGSTVPGGFGAAGSASGSASGAAGGSAAGAGGRSMAPGMMGGASGDDDKRRERSGLGGPIAPKLEDDEETGPRSRSAQAGSRDTLR